MNELTDEQILTIKLKSLYDPAFPSDGLDALLFARATIAAHEAQRPAGQEPYTYEYEKLCDDSFGRGWEKHYARKVPGHEVTQNVKPLYTSPQPATKPMTQIEIDATVNNIGTYTGDYEDAIVRAVERHHGIGNIHPR